jgi:outer membrane protein assembly factor BamB
MRRCAVTAILFLAAAIPQPALAGWSTYHGGTGLTGYAEVELGDELEVTWRLRLPGPIRVTPVTDGSVIYTAAGSHVAAISTNKRELWSTDLGEGIEAPPLVTPGSLVVGTVSGSLHSLDLETGRTLWTYELGSRIMGSPNIIKEEGALSVVAISQSDGVLHRVTLSDGKREWVTNRASRCDGALAVEGGLVVYGNCDAALYFHDAQSGRRIGKVELMTDGQVYSGVALADGSVYAGDRSGRLYAVNIKTRQITWVSSVAGADLSSTPAVSPEMVVFSSDDGSFYALSRQDGELAWSVDTGGRPLSPVIAGDRVLAAADGILFLLELGTGRVLDRLTLSDQITSPALSGSSILVGTEEGFLFNLGTRTPKDNVRKK